MKGLGALLTACVHKLIEQGTYKGDVTFLFCVYAFMRGCSLLENQCSFEAFVDLMHGKKFKYVRPGSKQAVTTAVTPEVFILQVDLLTSCTTDLKSDQYKCVITEESKTSGEKGGTT